MFEEMTFSAFESRFRDKTYIGSGGFGKVYKVFDHAKNHYVALKVADVRPEWKKFTLQNEVALVNSLPTHRNIARYDACYRFNTGLAGEMDFAILKFYEYGNLEQFISKQKLLPEDKKLIIRGMLDGLDFLHRHNVIHRDLKAQNILLHREDGIWTPKIIDFGLSRQIGGDSTITNSAIGLSYAYAAPEQIQNKKIYKNVDLWAAGVIIYRIIADELPFKGRDGGDEKSTQSQLELSRKIIQLELPDKLEQLPEPYRGMIKRCLVLDPAERIQTAHELIVLLNDNQVPTFGTSFFPPPAPDTPSPVEPPEAAPPLPPEPPTPESAPAVAPHSEAEEATQIIPERTDDPETPLAEDSDPEPIYEAPAAYPSLTRSDYGNIPSNPTQIIGDGPPQEDQTPPPTDRYQPKMGDPPSGGGSWRWALLLLLPLLVGGTYWYLNGTGGQKSTTMLPGEPGEPSPAPVEKVLSFRELDRAVYTVQKDAEALAALVPEIEKAIAAHPKDYEPRRIMANNLAYRNLAREAFSQLKRSAELALLSQQQSELLQKLREDQQRAYRTLSLRYPEQWNVIIKRLSE